MGANRRLQKLFGSSLIHFGSITEFIHPLLVFRQFHSQTRIGCGPLSAEKIRRVDCKTLEDVMMIEDPAVFTRPVYRKYVYNLRDDWDLMEYFCAEGNRDNVFDQKEGQQGSLKLTRPPGSDPD